MKKFILMGLILLVLGMHGHAQEIVVKPYIQPGPASKLEGADSQIVSWISEGDGGEFTVEYGSAENYGQKASVTSIPLPLAEKKYTIYRSTLENLPFDSSIFYKVSQDKKILRKASFVTRSKSTSIQFVVVGDQGWNKAEGLPATVSKTKIAYQMAEKKPPMGVVVGDIVYSAGRFSEYLSNYVPCFINPEASSPSTGSGILASSTFYFALGNHDIKESDLGKTADGMAAFYMWQPALNGPVDLPFISSPTGPANRVSTFKTAAGKSFPGLANYSFDNGPAHFLILDANAYVNVVSPEWRTWIEDDLKNSPSKWKFVFFHQPSFHSSISHYEEQRMRVLSPVFEKYGVDIVFAGHVHNYQRSKPLTFMPSVGAEKSPIALVLSKKTEVTGTFKLDEEFNGMDKTIPKGIIYIVTGSGGVATYDPDFTDKPEKWVRKSDSWAPYTVKFISDRSSFSHVTIENNTLTMRQIDGEGREVDTFKLTKP